jgi:hypothetical protein
MKSCGLTNTANIVRFYGATENKREIEMDMREMVDKIKRGEPLYGKSSLSEYHQAVAARNSRYSAIAIHLLPWFNFVNHPHVSDASDFHSVMRSFVNSTEWTPQNTTDKQS